MFLSFLLFTEILMLQKSSKPYAQKRSFFAIYRKKTIDIIFIYALFTTLLLFFLSKNEYTKQPIIPTFQFPIR
ncbi:MAG: hypothetical protein BGO32_09725 [Bacteroidetes bacterium 37-13]|nr:MAG: hypothetical protein BGO32_09725 [Bacteroidetes bacterium 37-13]